jgi:hypothetical protein
VARVFLKIIRAEILVDTSSQLETTYTVCGREMGDYKNNSNTVFEKL